MEMQPAMNAKKGQDIKFKLFTIKIIQKGHLKEKMKSNSSNSESWLITKPNPKHPPPIPCSAHDRSSRVLWDLNTFKQKLGLGVHTKFRISSSHTCQWTGTNWKVWNSSSSCSHNISVHFNLNRKDLRWNKPISHHVSNN